MLDFRIETFLALCETKSYTKAAEKLFITQPAVSQQIKYLEDRYGTPLFTFVKRQLSLTEAGTLLYRYASGAQSEGNKVEALLRSQGDRIPLRFGATRTIGEYILPAALVAYMHSRPDVRASMIVDNTNVLLKKLLEGSIDFAFIEGIFDRRAFETTVFLRDAFILVCSPENPLAEKTVELGDLLDWRLIVREQGSGSRVVLENALAGLNASLGDFNLVLELGNIEVIKTLVMEGLGIAFLYERSVSRELKSGRIAQIYLHNFSITHDYTFVRIKNSLFEKSYQEFLGYVIKMNTANYSPGN